MAMEEHSNKKRIRDDEPESGSPEVKRIRDDLLDFLDESDPDPTLQDLDSVMKSFEQEISPSSSSSVVVVDLTSDSAESQPELGYLLEASDDELGLPPSSAGGDVTNEIEQAETGELAVSGGLWGFDDQLPSYDSFGLGIEENYNADYPAFDDGLFEYSNVSYESSDFSDYPLRLGNMTAN